MEINELMLYYNNMKLQILREYSLRICCIKSSPSKEEYSNLKRNYGI